MTESEIREVFIKELAAESVRIHSEVNALKGSLKEAFNALCFAREFTAKDMVSGKYIPLYSTGTYMRAMASIGKHFQMDIKHYDDP